MGAYVAVLHMIAYDIGGVVRDDVAIVCVMMAVVVCSNATNLGPLLYVWQRSRDSVADCSLRPHTLVA